MILIQNAYIKLFLAHIMLFLEITLTSTSFAFSSVTKFCVVDYKQKKKLRYVNTNR